MEKSERKLIMYCADFCSRNIPYPYVRLRGIWLRDWGFNPGDQITITSPEKKTIIIKVSKTAEEVNRDRAFVPKVIPIETATIRRLGEGKLILGLPFIYDLNKL